MNAYDNYLALDLELNNAEDGSTPNPKIIEVGVAIGSWDHYKENMIITKNWYLDPQEPIFPFITNLTGISDETIITQSVSHEQCATELMELIKTHNTFLNPVTWGGGDSGELLTEFRDRNIHFNKFGRRWIDVKTWYVLHLLAKGRRPSGGLSSALSEYKLKFEGTPHRAIDDALNTLKLFFRILEKQSDMYHLITIAKDL